MTDAMEKLEKRVKELEQKLNESTLGKPAPPKKKREPSEYIKFCSERRNHYKKTKQHQELQMTELQKILSADWAEHKKAKAPKDDK